MVHVNNSNAASVMFLTNDALKSDHIASGKDPLSNSKVTHMESEGFLARIFSALKNALEAFMSFVGLSDKPINERKVTNLTAQTGENSLSRLEKQSDELASKAEGFLKRSKDLANKIKGSARSGEAMDAVAVKANEALKTKSMPQSTRAKYEALNKKADKANEGIQERKGKLGAVLNKTNKLNEESKNFYEMTTRLKEKMQQENEAYNNSVVGKVENFISNLFKKILNFRAK